MAAPSFVGAGAGVTIASGSAACTAAGSGVAVGDLVILQVLQDGTTASAVTYSAISGIANLAGTASSLTTLATDQVCGSTAKQHLRVGRATSTTCSVTVATTGDDLYYRIYVFRGVNSGTALTDILENGTAGTIANGSGATAAVADTGVTTLGVDRLPVQFVGVDDDNPLGPFTGMTGGTWIEATSEFATATGTDAAIQLQVAGTLFDQLTGASSDMQWGFDASLQQRAAKMIPTATGTVDLIVPQRVAGAPSDDMIVEIQTNAFSAPATNLPSGTAIGTPITLNVTGTTFVDYLAPVQAPVVSGTTYWVVLRRSGAINASNNYVALWATVIVRGGAGRDGTTWTELSTSPAFTALAFGMAAAGTIDGGSFTMAAADNWGVIGFALKPVPAVAGTNWTQPVADTLSLADSATTQSGKSATIGDTLALADALASTAAFARTITDPVTLADALSSQAVFARAVADTLTLADLADPVKSVGGTAHTQPVDDTLVLADALALGRGLTVTDTTVLADSLSSQAAFLRAVADTLSVVDTVVTAEAGIQQISDAIALADAIRFDRGLTLADSLALADAVAAGSDLTRAIADTVTLTDSVTAQKTILRALADTVSLADAIRFGRALEFADTVALADAVVFQAAYLRAVADTVSVTDAVTAGRELVQAVADTVALLDSLAATLGRAVLLEDVLALADAADAVLTAAIGEQPPAGLITFPSIGGLTRASRGPRTTQPTHGARTRADRGATDTPRGGVLTKTARGDVT